MDPIKEAELAVAMRNAFGAEAFQRASDNAYVQSLVGNEDAAAHWRRIMVLIRDLQHPGPRHCASPDDIDQRKCQSNS